jgi:hypothetical protein
MEKVKIENCQLKLKMEYMEKKVTLSKKAIQSTKVINEQNSKSSIKNIKSCKNVTFVDVSFPSALKLDE